jgi:hypothetical protein
MTTWTDERRATYVEKMRAWRAKPLNLGKWYAANLRSWTPERREAHRKRMAEFWGDPVRSGALRAKAAENGRKGAKGQMPRELRADEYDAYRAIKRKGRLTRAEALALVIADRRTRGEAAE